MQPDKPYRTFQEQIELLASHDIIVPSDPQAQQFALEQLQQYGYYNLVNAYQHLLADKLTEKYDPPVKFVFLIMLKQIDESLSSIILPPLLHFENTFAISLSYSIASHYGVWNKYTDSDPGYLANIHYQKNQMDYTPTLRRLRELAMGFDSRGDISRLRASASLLSYRKNHNHVPPWILTNDLSLGELTNWYLVSSGEIKIEVANSIFPGKISESVRKNLLANSLHIVRVYRNTIAHGTSITHATRPNKRKPRMLNVSIASFFNDSVIINSNDFNNNIGKNDLYSLLLILGAETRNYLGYVTMLGNLRSLVTSSLANDTVNITVFHKVFGFPENIVERIDHLIAFYRNK